MTPGRPWLLVLDTATSSVVVAAGTPDGELLGSTSFPAEHRHGERLLGAVDQLVRELSLARADLAGVIVGTGPGAFTGLRVGLATAKTIAHELGRPIVGVSTGEALLAAIGAPARAVLLLPAGPHDRVELRAGEPPRLQAGTTVRKGVTASSATASSATASSATASSATAPGSEESLVAVDLDGRAPEAALAAGRRAVGGLAGALLRIGVPRLASASTDDVARLVPEYVTLPRGVNQPHDPDGAMAWSSDHR
jgi:tRNA threonylcarbamoyl adenosine modification protein YeaZ